MSKYIEVIVIVEAKTEQIFIESILNPYLGHKNIGIHATQVSKPGQKGGDVKFSRVKKDIELHLRQRKDTYISTLVDYYGTREWPGIEDVPDKACPAKIAEVLYRATKEKVVSLFSDLMADKRFIPYISVHEFEALLFSDAEILSKELGISCTTVEKVLSECGSPEAINNNPSTAPSKRLENWSSSGTFLKTTAGINIADKIGVEKIRKHCLLFNEWIETLEKLQEESR